MNSELPYHPMEDKIAIQASNEEIELNGEKVKIIWTGWHRPEYITFMIT